MFGQVAASRLNILQSLRVLYRDFYYHTIVLGMAGPFLTEILSWE